MKRTNSMKPQRDELLGILEETSEAAYNLLEETLPMDLWYDENPELYVVGMLFFAMRDSVAVKKLVKANPDADISVLCDSIEYALSDIELFHDIGGENQYIDEKHLERFRMALRKLQFMNTLRSV